MNNLCHLQDEIGQRERELAQIRRAAAAAARHQEEEARDHFLRVIESMETEAKDAILQAESDAAASVDHARNEMERQMEQTLRSRENEIFAAAASKMEEEWTRREASVREEFRVLLSADLEDQHEALASRCDALVREKDEAAKERMNEMEEEHRCQLERLGRKMEEDAEAIWNEACETFGAAADEKISNSLQMAEEHCSAGDEERSSLRELLCKKESLLQDSVRDLKQMEESMRDIALDIHQHHEEEAVKLSEEALTLERDYVHATMALKEMQSENDALKGELAQCRSENDSLKGELDQCRLRHKSVEAKHAELMNEASTFDSEKRRLESRVGELSACKQLLERRLSDQANDNKELTRNSEMLQKKIDHLARQNESVSAQAFDSTNRADDLQQKCHVLERKHDIAIAHVKSLKQERRDYVRDMEDRIKQKDSLLAKTLDSLETRPKPRAEPVVVHLHGNGGDNENAPSKNERLSSECNNLRSKVLTLQRENFRLENDVMNLNQRQNDKNEKSSGESREVGVLQKENTSLKTIVSMMRKEMEVVASNDLEGEKPSLSEFLLEQQLQQCRSYLDLLLRARVGRGGEGKGNRYTFGGDELGFLRSKYQGLHRTADELREENARLHAMCNGISPNAAYDAPTAREKELIQKLEEATGEVEALLIENEKLMALSNELRFEVQQTRESRHASPTRDGEETEETNEYEQAMLAAILNDQSRSCDSESHESEVACIGRKPPMTSAVECRRSKNASGTRPKTASDRATASQRQSFQRLLNRKKKEISVEKTQIRNWNVKDPTTNPYLKT